jgi:UDP-glucose 4-epimerase
VNGSNSAGRAPFSEKDKPSPKTVYGSSKAEAEKQLETLAATTPMAVTAVRPPMIYGRPWRGSFDVLVRAILRGIPLPLGSIKNKRAFVSVDNVVSFVRHRLEGDARGFEVFIVADDEQISTPEFIRRAGRAMERRAHIVPCPPAIVLTAARLAGRDDLTDSLLGSLNVDTSKSKSTGWKPELTMDEGLARALA